MLWFARQVDGFRGWLAVVQSTGELRTGLVAGDFTITVVSPNDTASTNASVSESAQKLGLYYFDIPNSFITANGVGEYGVVAEVDTFAGPSGTPEVRNTTSRVLRVSVDDFDSIATSITNTAQFDLRQAWTLLQTPTNNLRAIVHLEQNGERVTLDGGATISYTGYDRSGSAIAGFSGSGTLRTIGTVTYFDINLAYTPTAGDVITVDCIITGSGVGTGTHRGLTEIGFPDF